MGKTWDGARWFEAGIAFFGVAAFLAVGPLRGALTELPGLRLTATLVLFLVPGAWLAHRFLHQHFSGVALLPAAFVVSVSVFALLGVPVLILQGTLENYLWVSGAAVAACLLAAALGAWRGGRTAEPAAPGDHGGLLWAPFLLLVAALAAVSRYNAPSFLGDIWVYLSWIREFLGGAMLASEEPYFGEDVGISRARINGWLLIQTAFSRVSGVDPIDLVFSYMNPALVVVALLAFYALARVLLKSERAALFCGCLYALFFLVHLSASRLGFGGEFAQRLLEDKLAAKFFFLPMALAFAVVFVRGGGRVYGWAFALLCWAVMAIHPIGLAVIGLSMAGFGILHLAANPRVRASWVRISALGLAGLSAIAVPWALVYAITGRPLTAVLTDSDINSGDPDVLTEHGLRELGSATHLRARGRLVHHAPVAAPGPDHRHRLPAGGAFPAVARRAQRGGAAAPGYVAADHRESSTSPPSRRLWAKRSCCPVRSGAWPGLSPSRPW